MSWVLLQVHGLLGFWWTEWDVHYNPVLSRRVVSSVCWEIPFFFILQKLMSLRISVFFALFLLLSRIWSSIGEAFPYKYIKYSVHSFPWFRTALPVTILSVMAALTYEMYHLCLSRLLFLVLALPHYTLKPRNISRCSTCFVHLYSQP